MSHTRMTVALCALVLAPLCAAFVPAGGARHASNSAPARGVADPLAAGNLPAQFVIRDWIILAPVDGRGRRPFRPDAVLRDHLLEPGAKPPLAGTIVRGEKDSANWTTLEAREDGTLDGELFSWAYARIVRETAGVWMAQLSGANTLFVNGEPFQGDLYRYGFGGVPVYLREGPNDIYVNGTRGGFELRFSEPPTPHFIAGWDRTIPDDAGVFGAVRVNATAEWQAQGPHAAAFPHRALDPSRRAKRVVERSGPTASIVPASFNASVLSVTPPRTPPLWLTKEAWTCSPGETVEGFGAPFGVPAVTPGGKHIETFLSRIDGSAQEYGIAPPTLTELDEPGLVLSLHGASVACRNQLGAHSRHPDLWIFVPTNRRPFGFDWQDWGRADAYEVLALGRERSSAAADRLYLLGHSMGGHGTWHLAANDPDTWAAIGPSAGWATFDSYTGRPKGELAELWQDADGSSRTYELIRNLASIPTFVVHGTADDNVPITEAREMIAALEEAGAREVDSHFQPGAGHWWDGDEARGADCLEWPAVFELFDRTRKDLIARDLSWTSVDPAVDARHRWVGAEQAIVQGKPVRIDATRRGGPTVLGNPNTMFDVSLKLETENVRLLRVDVEELSAEWNQMLEIDGERPSSRSLQGGTHWFERTAEGWRERGAPDSRVEKTAARSGGFKRAFDRQFLGVLGTGGDQGMDDALLARMRHDAQQWWYRGNGNFDMVQDEGLLDARYIDGVPGTPERNLILYGNADNNAAWEHALGADCPVRVEDGRVQIGDRVWEGDDLVCLFAYPRAGTDESLVGVIGCSGARGARLASSFATFVSGAGFPDLVLVNAEVLTKGDGGVLAAGWFEHDWTWNGGNLERGGEQLVEETSGE